MSELALRAALAGLPIVCILICPHTVIAGAATAGIAGTEGEVLRRTLVPCPGYALPGGALAWALTR